MLVSSELRETDPFVVWKLDRLGRSVKGLVGLVNELRPLGAKSKSSLGQRIFVDCAILHDDHKVFVGVFDELDIFQGIAIDQQ